MLDSPGLGVIDALDVANDVLMIELPEDIDLCNDLFPISVCHAMVVELLTGKNLAICSPPDFANESKGSLSDNLDVLVGGEECFHLELLAIPAAHPWVRRGCDA